MTCVHVAAIELCVAAFALLLAKLWPGVLVLVAGINGSRKLFFTLRIVLAAVDWYFKQKETKQNLPDRMRENSARNSNFGAPEAHPVRFTQRAGRCRIKARPRHAWSLQNRGSLWFFVTHSI